MLFPGKLSGHILDPGLFTFGKFNMRCQQQSQRKKRCSASAAGNDEDKTLTTLVKSSKVSQKNAEKYLNELK